MAKALLALMFAGAAPIAIAAVPSAAIAGALLVS
jgi:hypothetical protein